MHIQRWKAAGLGVGLLLTTAVSTTYAQPSNQQQQGNYGQGNNWWCTWAPWWPGCNPNPYPGPTPGPPAPGATPELDSLLLFGFGLTGLGGYAVTRYRARRRG
jgi:hypothetical protein